MWQWFTAPLNCIHSSIQFTNILVLNLSLYSVRCYLFHFLPEIPSDFVPFIIRKVCIVLGLILQPSQISLSFSIKRFLELFLKQYFKILQPVITHNLLIKVTIFSLIPSEAILNSPFSCNFSKIRLKNYLSHFCINVFFFSCVLFINSFFLAHIQGGSNMTGTDLCVNKPHCATLRE